MRQIVIYSLDSLELHWADKGTPNEKVYLITEEERQKLIEWDFIIQERQDLLEEIFRR